MHSPRNASSVVSRMVSGQELRRPVRVDRAVSCEMMCSESWAAPTGGNLFSLLLLTVGLPPSVQARSRSCDGMVQVPVAVPPPRNRPRVQRVRQMLYKYRECDRAWNPCGLNVNGGLGLS